MMAILDWHGVLSGQPLQWIISGFSHYRLGQRGRDTAGHRAGGATAGAASRRRTPRPLAGGGVGIAVSQYAAIGPTAVLVLRRSEPCCRWRRAILSTTPHSWSILPGDVWWLTPEFLCSMWGLGVFTSAFLVEEIAAGLRAVSHGQREAALSQGFSPWGNYVLFCCRRGWPTPRQPIVGQYLNLMKLSSLASGIGFAELTYRVRQIESYNAHALEAFAVGTALYLALGIVMGLALTRFGPGYRQPRSAQHER